MKPTIFLLLVALAAAVLISGCGESVERSRIITIRNFDFDPNERRVSADTTVTWVNADDVTHSVVSGVLGATSFPETVDVGILNTGFTGFDGDELRVLLGDVVRFRNLTVLPRQVEVKDQEFNILFLSPVLQESASASFETDRGGNLIVRDIIHPPLQMNLVVEGTPDPDGLFESGVLAPGDDFAFMFTTPGTFPYFCGVHRIAEGVVVVEP